MNASCILKCSKAIHALDIPHPAHDIPVMYFIGHVTPKLSIITYSTTTVATDVITSILLCDFLLYALSPLIIPPDNAFYYIIISPASNARQGSVIMLINVDKVTAPTASFWS